MADRFSVLVKFPADLLASVEAHAKSENCNRMAAILRLVERGLGKEPEPVLDAPRPKLSPARSKTAVVSGRSHAGTLVETAPGVRMSQGPRQDTYAPWMRPAPKGKRS